MAPSTPLRCPNCNAPVELGPGQRVFVCAYCNTQSTNPLYQRPKPPPRSAAPRPAPGPKKGGGARGCLIAVVALLLLVGMVVAISGNKKKRSYNRSAGRSVSVDKAGRYTFGTAEPAADSALDRKLNAYLGCLAEHSARARQARVRYRFWAGDDGPSCRERYRPSMLTLASLDRCRKGVATAAAAKPELPELERAGAAVVAGYRELAPLLEQAKAYYAQEDYEDDGCQKGKVLHRELGKVWQRLAGEEKALRKELFPRRSKLLARRLERAKKSRTLAYHFAYADLLLQADRTVLTLAREGQKKQPDVARMKAANAALSRRIGLLQGAEKKLKGVKPFYATSVRLAAGRLLTAAKRYRRRRQKSTPYSATEKRHMQTGYGWIVKGSFARVAQDYDRVLLAASRIRYR